MEVPELVGALERKRVTRRRPDAVSQLLAREVVQLVVPNREVPVFARAVFKHGHHLAELVKRLTFRPELVVREIKRALVVDDVAVVQREIKVVFVEVRHRILRHDQGVPITTPLRSREVGFVVHISVLDISQQAEGKRWSLRSGLRRPGGHRVNPGVVATTRVRERKRAICDREGHTTRNRSTRCGGERGARATGHKTRARAAHLKRERTTHAACARATLCPGPAGDDDTPGKCEKPASVHDENPTEKDVPFRQRTPAQ